SLLPTPHAAPSPHATVRVALPPYISTLFFQHYGAHRDLHSFPTRRSSDLRALCRRGEAVAGGYSQNSGQRKPDPGRPNGAAGGRSEEHTSELQSRFDLVCRLLLEKKNNKPRTATEHNLT